MKKLYKKIVSLVMSALLAVSESGTSWYLVVTE